MRGRPRAESGVSVQLLDKETQRVEEDREEQKEMDEQRALPLGQPGGSDRRGGGQRGDNKDVCLFVGWLVGCLTSQQHARVSQGRICSDNFTCCHTEIEVADPTFYLTQSQYTDTGPTSPSADPITPGAWQGSHWSANF